MNEPRRHLPGDLKALRYLDALNAGDLEAVARLWEEAADDPQLERMLTEIDEAMFQEIAGKPSLLSERLARPKRRWAVWSGSAGTLAAACLLAILAWPRRDTENQGPSPASKSERDRGRTPIAGKLPRPQPVTRCATKPGRSGNAWIRLAARERVIRLDSSRSARLREESENDPT